MVRRRRSHATCRDAVCCAVVGSRSCGSKNGWRRGGGDAGSSGNGNACAAVPPSPLMSIFARRDQRPYPGQTDFQRSPAKMLATYEAPHNLPVPVFAKLAGKSRDQINREIKGKRAAIPSLPQDAVVFLIMLFHSRFP